jgi:HAD superfamily hydrolase (TIGR01459 family)
MTVPFIERLSILAPRYDVLLCDVWGVIHNGVSPFPDACDALARFRADGGRVVLVTNAPRPSFSVIDQLDHLQVPRAAYDDVVSSGDVTRSAILARAGERVFHLGPQRDRPIFDGIDVYFTDDADDDYVVCTGLFEDDHETPDDYRSLLAGMLARNLFMACANPDVVVDKGGRLLYCAGALADLYRAMGGDVLYAGKPYRPIYDEALEKATALRGAATPPSRVLAIGDSLRTDYAGARDCGFDFLFVTSGIHAEELGARDNPDGAVLATMFRAAGGVPTGVTPWLRW